MIRRIGYRMGQGLRATFAFARPLDNALAAATLSAAQLALFQRLRRAEQLHSLAVLRAISAQTATVPSDLAVAALLHDVGKVCYPVTVVQKTFAVLLRTLAPARYLQLSKGDPKSPLARPFVVYERHAAWGAELAQAAGVSTTSEWLIAHHQEVASRWQGHPAHALLVRLQAADDTN